ncbi:MAG: hypothetical protein WCW67_07275 [Candidatus Margulisiibacteriota bacterium]|jgi:hypothetical protein
MTTIRPGTYATSREHFSSLLRTATRTVGFAGALGLVHLAACGGGDERSPGLEQLENGLDAGTFNTFDGGRTDALPAEAAAQTDAVSEEVKQDPPIGILIQSGWLYNEATMIGKTQFVEVPFKVETADGKPIVVPGLQNASEVRFEIYSDSTVLPTLYDDPNKSPTATYPCWPGICNLGVDAAGNYLINLIPAEARKIIPLYLAKAEVASLISNGGTKPSQSPEFDIDANPNEVGVGCAPEIIDAGPAIKTTPASFALDQAMYNSGSIQWNGKISFAVNTEGLSYSGYAFNVYYLIRVVK